MTIFKLHLFEVTLTSKFTFLCSPLLDCLFPHWNCCYDDYQRRVFASRSFYIVAKNSKELTAKLNAYAKSSFLCSPLLNCLFPHWNCCYDDYQRRVFASRSFYIVAKNSKELTAKLNAYARSKSHLTRSDCRTNNGNYFLLFEQGTFKTRKLRAAAFRRMRYQFAIKSILNKNLSARVTTTRLNY